MYRTPYACEVQRRVRYSHFYLKREEKHAGFESSALDELIEGLTLCFRVKSKTSIKVCRTYGESRDHLCFSHIQINSAEDPLSFGSVVSIYKWWRELKGKYPLTLKTYIPDLKFVISAFSPKTRGKILILLLLLCDSSLLITYERLS